METKTVREEVLNRALKAVNGERNSDYGEPEDCFKVIGSLWTTFLGVVVDEEDVAQMMILLKIARNIGPKTNIDNWIDIAGYAACGAACQAEALNDKYEEGQNE